MKLIIKSVKNKIELVRFLRKEFPHLTMKDAFNLTEISDLLPITASFLQMRMENLAEVILEKEQSDLEKDKYKPPQAYMNAMKWYEFSSDDVKSYVDAIVDWRIQSYSPKS